MKKTLACILAVLMSFGCCATSAFAATAPMDYGDANCDGSLDITDVTTIQMSLAKLVTLDYLQNLLADFNHDNEVSVLDATSVQKKLAGLPLPEGCGGAMLTDVRVSEFFADFNSGTAATNSPVTFTAKASVSGSGLSYEFLVDNEIAQPKSESNTFVYTFQNAGNHFVEVRAYNEWGFYNSSVMNYEVLSEAASELRLVTLYAEQSENAYTFVAQADGGTAPYTYCMTIKPDNSFGETGLSVQDVAAFNDYANANVIKWQLMRDEADNAYLYGEFSEGEAVSINKACLCFYVKDYVLSAQAKDAEGNISDALTTLVPGVKVG